LICQGNYPRTCRTNKCQQHFLDDIQQRSANNPSTNLQLRSVLAADQTIQFKLQFLGFSLTGNSMILGLLYKIDFLVPNDFTQTSQTSTSTATTICCTQQTQTNVPLVQKCIGQDVSRQPIIIDTDVDIDDLWGILYLVNVI
jgi:hypothetical protein